MSSYRIIILPQTEFFDEMRRKILLICVMMMEFAAVSAQDDGGHVAVIRFLGGESEEVDPDEVERLAGLFHNPMNLNTASVRELTASGLFSRYQVASLSDYISRNGEVLSFMELSSIDGFQEDYVMRIRPFVSVRQSSSDPGGRVCNEITARTSLRWAPDNLRWNYATRYRVTKGDAVSASLSLSRSLDASAPYPDAICASVGWNFRKAPVRLVFGDFNARFGQGLSLWNGSFLNARTSPSVFMKRPSGVTPSSSFNGNYSYTGTAVEAAVGRFSLTAFLAFPGLKSLHRKPESFRLMPAVNLTYNGRYGQIGVTHLAEFSGILSGSHAAIPVMKTSADAAACLRGTDIFCEVSYDWVERGLSALAGSVVPLGEDVDMAALMRIVPEEYSAALSAELKKGKWLSMKDGVSSRRLTGTLTTDVALYMVPKVDTQDRSMQLKIYSLWKLVISESLSLDLRLTERVRSWGRTFRTDIRSDLDWYGDFFTASMRLNFLKCAGLSVLGYLEGGFRKEGLSLYLRQGMFSVDDWEDRIYVYERDAPGCFNVPAFYGRGVWTSFVASWKFSRWGKVCFRASGTAYPFMKEKKPGKAELRLQFVFDF